MTVRHLSFLIVNQVATNHGCPQKKFAEGVKNWRWSRNQT